jgi:hypothetical protein
MMKQGMLLCPPVLSVVAFKASAVATASEVTGTFLTGRTYCDGLPRVWFQNGLNFKCTQCGKCCSKPVQQQVTVCPAEREAIARHPGVAGSTLERGFLAAECAPAGKFVRLLPMQHTTLAPWFGSQRYKLAMPASLHRRKALLRCLQA